MVTLNDCIKQSKQVWGQFGYSKWVPTAKKNAALDRRDVEELRHVGIGRTLVCVAMGASLEGQIETLKAHRSRFDLLTCDKGFKTLLDRGIKADFVHLADTNIETRWMGGDDSPTWEETAGVGLISTPYANHEWTKRWKGQRYFYVNKDAIRTEKHFEAILPGLRVIPASTNVSNAMVVFMTGSDEIKRENFGGYDRILLVGYDYSWEVGGSYYAFADPRPKRFYMAHRSLMDIADLPCRTSENLFFSARWMFTYLTQHSYLPVVNCSGRGILDIPSRGDLGKILSKISDDPEKTAAARSAFNQVKQAQEALDAAKRNFQEAKEAIYGGW